MIIETHSLQTFPTSNLNRDDTGNPKEGLYGGVMRARTSSQSNKRAIRMSGVFANTIQAKHNAVIGDRTKILISELAKRLVAAGMSEEPALELASDMISVYAKPDTKNPEKTSVLVFISKEEFDWIANQLIEGITNQEAPDIAKIKKELEKHTKNRTTAPDIALFGRMLADNPSLNIDAACQFSHALSTHSVTNTEFDFFTAVDDKQPDDEAGAGMMGLIPFNSATYYRCVRIDWEQLVHNLGGDVALAQVTVEAFMKAFAVIVPTGMKNSFVNQTKPDLLVAVTRSDNDGQSLMTAFEAPVRPARDGGYVAKSIEALATYWDKVEDKFRLSQPTLSVLNTHDLPLASDELSQAQQPNLTAWVDCIVNSLPPGDR